MKVKIAKIGTQTVTLIAETKKKQFGTEVIIPKYYFARMIIAEDDREALLHTEVELKSFDVVKSLGADGREFEMLENMVEA